MVKGQWVEIRGRDIAEQEMGSRSASAPPGYICGPELNTEPLLGSCQNFGKGQRGQGPSRYQRS